MITMKQMQAAAKWDTGMAKPEAKPPVAGAAPGSATRPPKDRKDSIEMVLVQAKRLCGDEHEMAQAWLRLCRDLEAMTEPEARMPRFTKLLHVLWIAATNDHT